MKNISILFLSILFFSCQQKQTKTDSVSSSDSIVAKDSIIVKENKVENEQIGDTIFMNFKNEKDLYIAEGALNSIHSRVYVKFKNEDLGELNGKIIPAGGKGNIRFNQIISPDKKSDGPFGIDLKTNLEQKGNYILVIGHSQMADNPFYGKFTVELENKKK
ncbi:hypothetical protein [Flavobacterium sp. UBA7680]|uniref:hypothetical protein n=1 Tax=Flavobacterium sp. UBA7680 TaxID=1946559 RepID=UPI0025C50BA1|nr:hypothetical protein [Flavobacterium sp. UBA7680]